jgi:hypothetical protein
MVSIAVDVSGGLLLLLSPSMAVEQAVKHNALAIGKL